MTPQAGGPGASGAHPENDTHDRRLIREALDDTVVVEAAAGTGKTTELVCRILSVLACGAATVEQIVAVTFTEKAAGELKLRLRQELEGLRHGDLSDAARRRLADAITRLEEAHISTIHGFCADLLRERPVEAGVDPEFRVLTEPEADALFGEAFDGWLAPTLEAPPDGVRRALRRSVWSRDPRDDDGAPAARLRRAARDLAEWRDFDGPWRRDPFDRDAALAGAIACLHAFAAMTRDPLTRRDPLFAGTAPARDLSEDIERAVSAEAPDPDAWEARLVDLAQDRDYRRAMRGRDRQYNAAHAREDVWQAYEALGTALDLFQRAADCDLAAALHEELRGVLDRYAGLKRRAGALDFVDLLLSARGLIRDSAEVRHNFQSRFTRIFVDEFQDTDPLQAEILLLLAAADPAQADWRAITPTRGKLFIVGDPKQAIYRFRRADVQTYRDVWDQLVARGARPVWLRTSFRATPGLQRFVNAAFRPLMTGDSKTLQSEYVELSPYRPAVANQPSVVALPVPEPYGKRQVAGYAIDKSLPHAVAAFIDWLLNESGWSVTERTTGNGVPELTPIKARHVCVLFRRFLHFDQDVTRAYVSAIEARGIPHLLVGGKSFHGREEVETLRAALAAIEWPDDELSVFATLRGALFAIGDEELLEYRSQHGPLRPYRPAADLPDHLRPIAVALTCLANLRRERHRRPVGETIAALLDATRAPVGFVLRRGGEQTLANVLHIAELARQYEAAGGLSFRGFLDALGAAAESGQAAEAPILEEGSDGVRLMTVHKAKGLEFPVVVLADITAKLATDRADRHLDRARGVCVQRVARWSPIELLEHEADEVASDRAEGVRLAYVAATRARDLLVVPAVGDEAWEGGWVSPLNAALYPAPQARRTQTPAPGCPPQFKKDSVLLRPENDSWTPLTVCPGLHTMGGAERERYDVVWWDPFALNLDVPAAAGLRREDVIAKDVPAAIIDAGRREYDAWRTSRRDAVRRGQSVSIAIRTVTESAAESRGPAAGDVAVIDLAGPLPRPGGARFGELVHAVLSVVPLDAGRPAIDRIADVQGRILRAASEEVAAAASIVERVLAHEIIARARHALAAGRCRRECPVTYRTGSGELLEGLVDLAFEHDGAWTVVDYKTDRELAAAGEERYRRQVAIYTAAIAQATGAPASGVLIRV